jgi:mannose-6-phosphate isomerase-like protein (cupin superfamily)
MRERTAARSVVHGGARRLEMRWQNVDGSAPVPVSRYEILPGEECSKHVHTGKLETWVIVSGEGRAFIGEKEFAVSAGDALVTPAGIPHALRNTGAAPLIFLNLVSVTGDGPVTTTELA